MASLAPVHRGARGKALIIQFAYIKIAFEMYGQYHLPRGNNPALSYLIGFVSMDRVKQQNYSTIVLQYK
mgnify:CR=1 FL=1